MRVAGRREKRTRLVQTDRYVVAVEVEAVFPDADPTDACYESETVELLRQVQEHAERGDVSWLMKHGRVYERLGAA